MEFGSVNRKGQLTIEFLLLLALVMMAIHSMVQPAAIASEDMGKDVARMGAANLAAGKLKNAIEYVAMLPDDSRQTLYMYVPEGASIKCGGGNITADVSISDQGTTPGDCATSESCSKAYSPNLPAGVSISCQAPEFFEGMNKVRVGRQGAQVVVQ